MDTIVVATIDTVRDTVFLVHSGEEGIAWLKYSAYLCPFLSVLAAWFALLYMVRKTKVVTKPLLCFNIITDESRDCIGIELQNSGYGPAIIKKVEVKSNGVEIDTSKFNYMQEAINKFEIKPGYKFSIVNVEPESPLPVGFKKFIIGYHKNKLKQYPEELKRIFTEQFEMKIIYASLFGVVQTVTT